MDITRLSVAQLAEALEKRELSAVETAQAYIDRIQRQDAAVGAYLSLSPERALENAQAVDGARARGESLPPLAGVPAAIKDNLCTAWGKTTCASKMLENFAAPYTATAVEKLAAAKCSFLGKVNMDEFAMGSSTENSAFHATHNPRDLSRVPGGSSGGSAACVAADEAAFALGSDTGGSIRQPASFCGVVGLKPTYGRVSRYGLVAFASSLDQIGPLTKTVEDAALVLSAICGHDPRDTTSVPHRAEDFSGELGRGVAGMKLALPKEYLGEGVSDGVRSAVLAAAERFRGLGAEIVEVSMPLLPSALPAYYIISSAEASSNLGRFDGVKYGYRAQGCETLEEMYLSSRSQGFGREVKRRIMLGTFALSSGYYDAYYKKALQVRTRITREFAGVLDSCDAILAPVAPTVAYALGEKTADPLEMYMGDIFTVPVNIAGLPSLSMPCGEDGGLPVGMQLIGKAFGEAKILRIGAAFEEAAGCYHLSKPQFGGEA